MDLPTEVECGSCKQLRPLAETRACLCHRTEDKFFCFAVCTEKTCPTPNACANDAHTCWEGHLPTRREEGRQHEESSLKRHLVRAITFSNTTVGQQEELHEKNSKARWFKVARDSANGELRLYVYDRFHKLCDSILAGHDPTRQVFPTMVSFIGDTSVGKSTIIRAMILLGVLKSTEVLPQGVNLDTGLDDISTVSRMISALQKPLKKIKAPVPRSTSQKLTDATTCGVHLYRDRAPIAVPLDNSDQEPTAEPTTDPEYPLVFVDCEGFDAGSDSTAAARMERARREGRTTKSKPKHGKMARSPSRRKHMVQLHTVTPSCYTDHGKDGVDLFYARYLFAVSDVVVFVTKEDTKIRKELNKVLLWAAKSIHTTINSPRKSLIIVRNMPDQHRPEMYDEGRLADEYLDRRGRCWVDAETTELKEFVDDYNRRMSNNWPDWIQDNEQLYRVLFRKVICCYIPSRKNPDLALGTSEVFRQYVQLRNHIEEAARESINVRRSHLALYNATSVEQIHRRAFRHLSSTKEPFDLYKAARKDNPDPRTMQAHIGNFLRHLLESERPSPAVTMLAKTNVVMAMLAYTTRTFWEKISPEKVFDDELNDICHQALVIYTEEYENCAFLLPGGKPCMVKCPYHQRHCCLDDYVPGPMVHKRQWTHDSNKRKNWIQGLRAIFVERYKKALHDQPGGETSDGLYSQIHKMRRDFNRNEAFKGFWKDTFSNKTCFTCLQAVPDHALRCGHSFCPRCVQELGEPSAKYDSAWELTACWLCWDEYRPPREIRLRPRCAGVRVLSLDGGGVRGIASLNALMALENAIDLKSVDIRDCFDLIIGTSTGGIIALAVALSGKPFGGNEGMINFFKQAAKDTFSGTRTPFRLLDKTFVALGWRGDSMYKPDQLFERLKEYFGENTSLFAPAMERQATTARVAVTAAINQQDGCLITNYNYPCGKPGQMPNREEDPLVDTRIWEAAAATSAAPVFLPPFIQTRTGTEYVDGAVYANCPAQLGYVEVDRLWPDHAASMDLLISVGTGSPEDEFKSPPGPVRFNCRRIIATVRNIFESQIDARKGWEMFRDATPDARGRLHRLDPQIREPKVRLDHYKHMQRVESETIDWCGTPHVAMQIRDLADALIAGMFFFEPHHEPGFGPRSKDTGPDQEALEGSIRARLRQDRESLEPLLAKVESFWRAEVDVKDVRVVGGAVEGVPEESWSRIGDSRLDPVQAMTMEERVCRFRLDVEFRAVRDSRRSKVVAVILKGRTDAPRRFVPISGFPASLVELNDRAKMKWVQ